MLFSSETKGTNHTVSELGDVRLRRFDERLAAVETQNV
jgi:hypothetical protein